MEEKRPLLNGSSTSTAIQRESRGNRGLKQRVLKRITDSYRIKSLMAVKPIEAFIKEREARPEGSSLAERLGLIDLLGYGVGCTVGAGIYSLIGIGAGIAGAKNRFV